MSNLLPIGTLVRHGFANSGHGPGKITGYNITEPNKYVEEKFADAVNVIGKSSLLLDGIVSSFYSGDRYPYQVTYLNGYRDVYGAESLVVMPAPSHEFVLTRQTHDFINDSPVQVRAQWPVTQYVFKAENGLGRHVVFLSGGFTLRYRFYDKNSVPIEFPWEYMHIPAKLIKKVNPLMCFVSSSRLLWGSDFDYDDNMRTGIELALTQVARTRDVQNQRMDFEVFFNYESLPVEEYFDRVGIKQPVNLKSSRTREQMLEFLSERDKLGRIESCTCECCGTNYFK